LVVKSDYVNGQPVGCLECHEVFEGHGGNRVNNVQVCVMCHNPNLTSSGRTINPASATPINPVIVAKFGPDPLLYPEVPNNFRELIHGLHAGQFRRVSAFDDIRNRTTGGFQGVYVDGNEITYPGYLGNCVKCHLPDTYDTVLPPNLLLTTASIPADPLLADNRANIIAARNTVPNAWDLVITPTASACGHCHNSPAAITHLMSSGGAIKATRGVATIPLPTLGPDVTP
jgi:OmcA/MtrC family decaheme c-type cytochrome